jgi:hypothetical protein
MHPERRDTPSDLESSELMAVWLLAVNTIHKRILVYRLNYETHVARAVRNAGNVHQDYGRVAQEDKANPIVT